jgi:hypothetical protein
MAEKNLLTDHTKGERGKKRKPSAYFFMCFVMTRKKKKRCVCVWNERIFAGAAAERAKGNRCDEGSGAAKIMGCVAAPVVRCLVHARWKDKLVRIIAV